MSIVLMTAVWPLDIPSSDKLVLLALADAAHDDGITWMAVRTKREGKLDILTKTSLSERSIQGAIRRLCSDGYLHRKENPGRGVVYLVDPERTGDPDFAIPFPFQTPAKSAPTPAKSVGTPATTAGKPSLNRQRNEDPPSPPGGTGPIDLGRFAKALEIVADAGCDFETLAERIHLMQPVVGGKRRSAAPDVRRAFSNALKRGGRVSAIWAALRAYYALPANTKDGGQFASGSAVVLNEDRWKEFQVQAEAASTPDLTVAVFDGPPALRDSVVKLLGEPFARSWIDTCRWNPATRTLLARNAFALSKLNDDLGLWMRQKDVRAAIFGAAPPPAAEPEPEEPI